MNVVVLGGGGREHAICRGLKRSPEVTKLYCSPGNPGIAQIAECVALPAGDIQAVADFAAEHQIDLVVVGPELPLCQGVADAVRAAGIPVFGPSKDAARLEGSKDFSKKFMVKYGIPTAAYASFTDKESALRMDSPPEKASLSPPAGKTRRMRSRSASAERSGQREVSSSSKNF